MMTQISIQEKILSSLLSSIVHRVRTSKENRIEVREEEASWTEQRVENRGNGPYSDRFGPAQVYARWRLRKSNETRAGESAWRVYKYTRTIPLPRNRCKRRPPNETQSSKRASAGHNLFIFARRRQRRNSGGEEVEQFPAAGEQCQVQRATTMYS